MQGCYPSTIKVPWETDRGSILENELLFSTVTTIISICPSLSPSPLASKSLSSPFLLHLCSSSKFQLDTLEIHQGYSLLLFLYLQCPLLMYIYRWLYLFLVCFHSLREASQIVFAPATCMST